MIVILEGVDGAGKTTLARRIGEWAGTYRYVHSSQPKGDPYTEYRETIEACPRDELTVIDRLHWGEMVYGPLFRGESALSWSNFRRLERQLMDHGPAMRILVDPGQDIVLERLRERGDDFIKLQDVQLIRIGFIQIFEHAADPKVYAFDETDLDIVKGWFDQAWK